MKIVVFVDGGNVHEVYAPVRDAEHIDVVLVDYDNLKESHNRDERDAILERETEGLTTTFITNPDLRSDALNLNKVAANAAKP